MRKLLLICFWIVNIYALLLTCSAEALVSPPIAEEAGYKSFYKTWEEYQMFLADGTPSEKFVYYESVQAFGDFNGLSARYTSSNQPVSTCFECTYFTIDENNVSFVVFCAPSSYDDLLAASVEADSSQMSDMRNLLQTAYYGEHLLRVRDICFKYREYGVLENIVLKRGEIEYTISGNDVELCSYPHYGKSTLMMRLLDPKTTEATIDELYARLDGTYKEPVTLSSWVRKPPVLVGIGAISGAAVAAFVTYLIMRKRRGGGAVAAAATPVDAMADTSTDIPTDITPPEP